MRKKGQIGQTMTWMVAFIVIFFAVTIFLVTVLIMSGNKALFEKDEITLDEKNVDLNSQKMLIEILNSKMEDGQQVKDFIKNGIVNPNSIGILLELVVERKLQNLGQCDYLFLVEYDIDNLKEFSGSASELTYRRVQFGNVAGQKLIDNQEGLSFFVDDKRIRTKLYLGECKNE